MERRFIGKTVMITGGASGIGFLCGKCFAKEGANVVLMDINEDALKEKQAEILGDGGKVIYTVTNVRSYQEIVVAKERALQEFGSIDVIINCAGGNEMRVLQQSGEFFEVPIEAFDWSLEVNGRSQFYMAHAVMGQMAKQKNGVIINIGSVTGEEGDGRGMGYATAKSGVMYGLTKSLAIAGGPYNIRAVCVTPGPILTRPGMAAMKTVMGRAGEVQELVNVILFLASKEASFITGVNYVVDGGRLVVPRW